MDQHQWGEGTAKVGCGDCGAVVRVSRKDPAKLSGGELQDRVVDLAEARARLDGEYLAALGELAARDGAQGAAHVLRNMNRMTSAAARGDALQRAERKATLNYGTDGMWHLRGRFDFLTGRRINQALDAEVYCGVFNADWTNLALGRSRNANDAQRLILAARDRGCTGCGAHTEPTPTHHRRGRRQHPHRPHGQDRRSCRGGRPVPDRSRSLSRRVQRPHDV